MGIAAAIIGAIGAIGGSVISGVMQNKALDKGQEESRQMYLTDLSESRATRRTQEKLTRQQMRESKRQFDLSYGLQREQLGMQKQEMASDAFHNQVSRLTQIMGQNEQLKNVYLNRLKGLRRAA